MRVLSAQRKMKSRRHLKQVLTQKLPAKLSRRLCDGGFQETTIPKSVRSAMFSPAQTLPVRPNLNQPEHRMGRRIVFKPQHSVPDRLGLLATEHRVDQAVELVGELMIGQRVLIVAGGKGDLFDQLGSVTQGHGHAVGNARGITGRELGVLDDRRARDQVDQCRDPQAARG